MEEYVNRAEEGDDKSKECGEWYTIVKRYLENDGGFMLRNICRVLNYRLLDKSECDVLVRRFQID